MNSPQPAEIVALASTMGYKERRPEASATLFFAEINPSHGMPPVLLNVYYTTRSIMSYMNHPTAGTNEMWRSSAYSDLEELKTFFENPRRHSGKGYRNKNKAARGCVRCGAFKLRTEFSKNQWIKGPDFNKCKECVDAGIGSGRGSSLASSSSDYSSTSASDAGDDDDVSELSDALSGVELADDFPSLTSDLLDMHDRVQSKGGKKKNEKMERRQFNCPECPKQNRGKHVFFKKVPAYKPIVKCPKCKAANRGRCMRLYPVPKTSEKGYGLFKCHECKGNWGSSRAIQNIGQECFDCKVKGKTTFVKPFRLEVVKLKTKSHGGILGGGPRSRMRRVPTEPIGEFEEAETGYTETDRNRNSNAAGNALAGDAFSGGESGAFKYEPRSDYSSSEATTGTPLAKKIGVPAGYVHRCEGCKSGLCRSRYLPKSLQHDTSDGNTVSTSASIMTNSSIDKADFIDRDEDFDDFENEEGDWVTIPAAR